MKIQKVGLVGLFLSFFVFSPVLKASNFNYTNFEVGVTTNPSSFAGKTRLAFTENAHVLAEIISQFQGDWLAAFGTGFHAPINTLVDVHGDARLYSVKFPNNDKHDFGELAYSVNVGLRAWILPQIEANLLFGQIAFDANDTRSVVEFGGRFHSTDALSIGINYYANGLYKEQLYFSVRFEI